MVHIAVEVEGIARHVQAACPTLDRYIAVYERYLSAAAQEHHDRRLSDSFQIQSFEEDIEMIGAHIRRNMQPSIHN